MNEYRYILEPYKGPDTRHTCPSCQHKHEFSLYIDIETRKPIHPSVGKCNREQKCGYHYTPSEYFRDNSNENMIQSNLFERSVEVKKPERISYLPEKFIPTLNCIEKNNLFRFFVSKFGEDRTRVLFAKYKIGTSKHWINNDGYSCVFPQIDIKGNLRQLKIIAYNPITGKRLHKEHSAQKFTENGYVSDTIQDKVWFAGKTLLQDYNANLVQCFFGEHLLPGANKISIVESEKTAMIASIYMPDFCWIATGGKNGCRWYSENVANVLRGKNVWLYPDLGCTKEWIEKGNHLRSLGVNLNVSEMLETIATSEERKNGLDVGDFLLRRPLQSMKKGEKPTTIGDVCRWMHELGFPRERVTINIR